MRTPFAIFAVVAWLSLLVFCGFEGRLISRQRTEQDALSRQQRRLEAEAAGLRREGAAIANNLTQAEQQLAALPTTPVATSNLKPAQREEINAWLSRIRKLRKFFAEQPGRAIPEMQFLKDEDWLRIAKIKPVEDDEDLRAAAAAVRDRAIGVFAERVSMALRKYNAANPGAPRPSSVQELVMYFEPPVDPAILERYAIVDKPGYGARSPLSWAVGNRAPIDPEYDARFQIVDNGWTSAQGLTGWMPELVDRYHRVRAELLAANPGSKSKSVDDMLPYFNPPLDRDLADRLRRWETRNLRN